VTKERRTSKEWTGQSLHILRMQSTLANGQSKSFRKHWKEPMARLTVLLSSFQNLNGHSSFVLLGLIVIEKRVSIENIMSLSDINRYNRYYGHARHGDEDLISHLFDVWLLVKNPSDDVNKLKLAGTLEVSQSNREFRPKGHFFNDDGYDHGYTHDAYFLPPAGSGVASISVRDLGSKGWQFARQIPSRPDLVVLPWDLECVDFYALNNTPELTLKVTIKIPSKS